MRIQTLYQRFKAVLLINIDFAAEILGQWAKAQGSKFMNHCVLWINRFVNETSAIIYYFHFSKNTLKDYFSVYRFYYNWKL